VTIYYKKEIIMKDNVIHLATWKSNRRDFVEKMRADRKKKQEDFGTAWEKWQDGVDEIESREDNISE